MPTTARKTWTPRADLPPGAVLVDRYARAHELTSPYEVWYTSQPGAVSIYYVQRPDVYGYGAAPDH